MININTGFKMGSAEPIDGRMVLTSEEMTTMNDNIMPEVYLATNKDDGRLYLYNKTNEVDPTTGKFRIMKSEGGALVFTKAEWQALDPKPAAGTQVIISDDTTEGGTENIIDDDSTDATDKTWSVSKINNTINSIDFKGEAPENANSATIPGAYFINRSDNAYPAKQGFLIVSRPHTDYNHIIQEVYDFSGSTMYSRSCWNNTWYNWRQHAYSNELGKLTDLNTTDKSSIVGAVNEINDDLAEKADKDNAVVRSLKIKSTNGTAQIIPWTDGTHYRSIDGNDGNDYTDIITKDGAARIVQVKNNTAIKDEVIVTNGVTTTTFINSSNTVYKQGKMCTATIMNLLLNTTYNTGEVLGTIGDSAFYPKTGIRGLVVQLNSGQASEIRINSDGTITAGQATALTSGYWVGNFSWVTN